MTQLNTGDIREENQGREPKLGWSVVALFLFAPFGLMALLYSIFAEFCNIQGHRELSVQYSARAGDWRLWTWLILIPLLSLWVVFNIAVSPNS